MPKRHCRPREVFPSKRTAELLQYAYTSDELPALGALFDVHELHYPPLVEITLISSNQASVRKEHVTTDAASTFMLPLAQPLSFNTKEIPPTVRRIPTAPSPARHRFHALASARPPSANSSHSTPASTSDFAPAPVSSASEPSFPTNSLDSSNHYQRAPNR